MSTRPLVVVSGAFDDMRARDVLFVQQAAALGSVTALVWSDELVQSRMGWSPRFPLVERLYFVDALRYVARAIPLPTGAEVEALPDLAGERMAAWVEPEGSATAAQRAYCRDRHIEYHVLPSATSSAFPEPPPQPVVAGRKTVIVSGSFDWFHTGHVRFLEEASRYGNLYAVVGHDANIRRLKGDGHPLLREDERRYMVGSIRCVTQALISTGDGWLDADPEVRRIQPDLYIVNEDGDKGGKREYCERLGIEYVVLSRTPAPGLPARSSTELRGF